MNEITFEVIEHNSKVYHNAVNLREVVLRKPLGLRFFPEELEKEKDHIHIVGIRGDEVVATTVLVPEGDACKMQRVVVKSELQNQGIGIKMMRFCEKGASQRGFKEIYCHARDTAVQFYLKNHYVSDGDYFLEDTIPHLKMRKKLI